MTATATAIETSNNRRGAQRRPTPESSAGIDPDAEARAEHAVFHDAGLGAAIGAILFAPLYTALVSIALLNRGTALVPPLLMAAGVGALAGVFIGGWAGTLVGASKLEREHRPKPSTVQPEDQSRR